MSKQNWYHVNTVNGEYATGNATEAAGVAVSLKKRGLNPSVYVVVRDLDNLMAVEKVDITTVYETSLRLTEKRRVLSNRKK
jgi:hypothetical protein